MEAQYWGNPKVAQLEGTPARLINLISTIFLFFGFQSTQLARQLQQERTELEVQE